LQHGDALAFAKLRYQSTWLPSRKFDRVVVTIGTSGAIWLNLPTRQSSVRVQIQRLSY